MRWRRLAPGLVVALIAVGLGGELYARYGLGLGDPPLTIRDPEIDYLFKPGTYHRFGNTITYNSFSMRADEIEPTKTEQNELRVLVFGDSVLNGGVLTDDSELATRLAQDALTERLQRPVWVGNVSAGSWAPGNHLGYANRYGWFDADVVIFLLSSHDIGHVPLFLTDLGPDFPLQTPPSALLEGALRYLPRYLPWPEREVAEKGDEAVDPPIDEGRELFRQTLNAAQRASPTVVILHHLERAERVGEPAGLANLMAQHAQLLEEDAASQGVEVIPLEPYLDAAADGVEPFRDAIHINAEGQRLYADAIICVVERAQGLNGETCA